MTGVFPRKLGVRVGFAIFVMLTIVVSLCIERELPVIAVRREGATLDVRYYEIWAPRVRLSATCEGADPCRVRAYRSYAPWAWSQFRRERRLAVPAEWSGRSFAPGWPDRTVEAAR